MRRGVDGALPDETCVVYVSPLKALSNDIQRNLEAPLAGIRAELAALGYPDVEIRTLVRTGDTPQSERASMRRRPPHIVVTTPESLYVLLGSDSGRTMLATTRTVIVDEIHALAPEQARQPSRAFARAPCCIDGNASGAHGLVGNAEADRGSRALSRRHAGAGAGCTIVDTGHVRERDLALEVPPSPLEAVMSGEVWQQVYRGSPS